MDFLKQHAHSETQYEQIRNQNAFTGAMAAHNIQSEEQAKKKAAQNSQRAARKDLSEEEKGGSQNITNNDSKKAISLGVQEQKQSISELFGLSSNAQTAGLQSITQQLQIWENSMKGFNEKPGYMLKLNGEKKREQWKKFAQERNIQYTYFGNNTSFKAVVDLKYKKDAYDFTNTYCHNHN